MPELGEPLSERELEVLRQMAGGASNKEIADDLSISPYTVKTHLRNIYTKLGASTRTEAMTVALQQGVLTVPGDGAALPTVADEEEEVESSRETAVEESPGGPPVTAGRRGSSFLAHPWRTLSLILLALIIVTGALLILARWRDLTVEPTPAAAFEETPLGDTRWSISRPLPAARASRAAASVGLDVYLIGGEDETGVTGAVDVYNTAERVWRSATKKPTPVADATAAELFGEIYVAGGRLDDGRPTGVVEAYSPSQDAWRRVASLPQPLAGALALSDGGFLYVFGGRNENQVLDAAYVYDPGADAWRPLAGLPEPTAFAAGGVLKGELYVVGGDDGQTAQAFCFTYNPLDDAWSRCPEMIQPRAGAGAAVLVNKLYVIGGGAQDQTGVYYGEVYDPNSRTWQVVNMPENFGDRQQLGIARVENRIYTQGGREGETLRDDNLVYAPFVYQTYIPAAASDSDE